MEEESLDNILIICRHSERIDYSKGRLNQKSNKGDPELTNNGIILSKYLGKKIIENFGQYIINKNEIQLYSSPFTRTLETAITLRNEIQKNYGKNKQILSVVKDLGEWNFYDFDLYQNILFYNQEKIEKDKELYKQFIFKKIQEGNVDYDIISKENCFINFPESEQQANERYLNALINIINNIKEKHSNIIILVTHGQGVSALCRYLCNKIKEKNQNSENNLYPTFLDKITGYNQKYCNSFCFKIDKTGENISFFDEICYQPEFIIDSKILKYENIFKNSLIKWLKNPCNDKTKEIKNIKQIILLYRGSKDGFQSKIFHQKCDKKGETLTIIKSSDNYIFGGYTEINWDSTVWNGQKGDKNNTKRNGIGNEFVFTLVSPYEIKPQKYNLKKRFWDYSIYCDGSLGPVFGCYDIKIEDNCNIKENKFTFYEFKKDEISFNDTTGKKRLLFTGKDSFIVKEIEVFQIIR